MIDFERFREIKKRAESKYRNFENVNCPYLKEKVNFNTKGLDHIKFKRWNKTRSIDDQYMRLKLIEYAPKIIEKSYTLQGYSEISEFEHKKINSRWERILLNVKYYEFVAVLDGIRIRVIVKYVPGGEKYFWSIIPFWKMDRSKMEKILHDGKPSED